jgi:hypothetical protein
LKTVNKFYRIDRREICYLKFILESYDGIATMSTLDPGAGLIRIDVPPEREPELECILQDLKSEILMESVTFHSDYMV